MDNDRRIDRLAREIQAHYHRPVMFGTGRPKPFRLQGKGISQAFTDHYMTRAERRAAERRGRKGQP